MFRLDIMCDLKCTRNTRKEIIYMIYVEEISKLCTLKFILEAPPFSLF